MSSFAPQIKPLGELLQQGKLFVPSFQRSYAWRQIHVADFFHDIRDAMRTKRGDYYMGTVALVKNEEDALQIVDGQQRLTTATILFAVIRNVLQERSDDSTTGEKLARTYLWEEEIFSDAVKPKLRLNTLDQSYFVSSIVNPKPGEFVRPTMPSHWHIKRARDFLMLEVSKLDSADIEELFKFLTSKVTLFTLSFEKGTNPYKVFETLNTRGLGLSVTDLVKNHLFGKADTSLGGVEASWYQMVGKLEIADADKGDEKFDTFFRHFWISYTGKVVRKNNLFPDFQAQVQTQEQSVRMADRLVSAAGRYRSLLAPDSAAWVQYGPSTLENLLHLNTMGMIQVRPVILAILEHFPRTEIENAVAKLHSASVRFLVSGRSGSGVIESLYATVANQVLEGKIKTSNSLAMALSRVCPTDSQFEEDFSSYSTSKGPIARLLLQAFEKERGTGAPTGLEPSTNPEVVNLEHVLPKSPKKDGYWFSAFEDPKPSTYLLGNQCLMRAKSNAKQGNTDFESKKLLLKQEPFEHTKSIADFDNWNHESIATRQRQLAKLAVKVWKL